MFPDQVLIYLFRHIFDLSTLLAIQLTCKRWRNAWKYIKKEKRQQLAKYENDGTYITRSLGMTKKIWVNLDSLSIYVDWDENQQEPIFVLWKKINLVSQVEIVYSKSYDYKVEKILDQEVHNFKKIIKYIVVIDGYRFSFDPRNKYPLSRRYFTRRISVFYDRFLFLREITIEKDSSKYIFSLQIRRRIIEEYYIFRLKIKNKQQEIIYQFADDVPISKCVSGSFSRNPKLDGISGFSFISCEENKFKLNPSFIKDKSMPLRKEVTFYF
jgi:hypothetical protein